MAGIRLIAACLVVVALMAKGQFMTGLLLSVVIAVVQALFQAPGARLESDKVQW